MESVSLEQPPSQPESSANAPQTGTAPDSPAIRRLMDEVRCEDTNDSSATLGYNRAHNRHNRS
jgi:hypothetical protein